MLDAEMGIRRNTANEAASDVVLVSVIKNPAQLPMTPL